MTRGIHLKELRTTDLELLGLKDERPLEGGGVTRASLLEEVDPVLYQVVGEMRDGLEGTLRLLDEALASTTFEPTAPQHPKG